MRPIFVNIKASDKYYNLGDVASSPLNYFDWDVDTACLTAVPDNDQPLVLGGGGLLMPSTTDWLRKQLDKREIAFWGAGLNYPLGPVPDNLLMLLDRCRTKLVGLRDRLFARDVRQGRYIPCASCMHPAFLTHRRFKPGREAVVYRHGATAPYMTDLPCLTNTDRDMTLEHIITFLSSAEVVITDSYHGAYWAHLLGRKVIVWKGNAMRFHTGLPANTLFAHTEEQVWALLYPYSTLRDFAPDNDFLTAARHANQWFAQDIAAAFKIVEK